MFKLTYEDKINIYHERKQGNQENILYKRVGRPKEKDMNY